MTQDKETQTQYKHLPLSEDIANLNTTHVKDNLFNYTYHSRYLTKLQNRNFDKEDPHYISTYSSFVGEVYENIIYELLLRYAISSDMIDRFVLKGPHQDNYTNEKNGLLIDRNNQIVYKSGYKDVSEFDGLFFGDNNNELWFVESTIVKTTASLKKRLKKKKALLKLIFPNMIIRALIILSQGAIGANSFPSYCTVWITKVLNDTSLIQELLDSKELLKSKFTTFDEKKLIETKHIKVTTFKYFETLSWLLKNIRQTNDMVIDFDFLSTDKIAQYFDIFSKLYIGWLDKDKFAKYYPDIEHLDIENDKVVATIEKIKSSFVIMYYIKINKGKLKKIEFLENEIKLSDKDAKGFTASEMKFMKYIWKDYHKLSTQDIDIINTQCISTKEHIVTRTAPISPSPQPKRPIYLLSDKVLENINNLPIFSINFLPMEVDLSLYGALIFTSKNGILSMESYDKKWQEIPSYTISYQTAKVIESYNGNLAFSGKNAYGNKFAKELVPLLKDKKVLYVRPKSVASKLTDILKQNEIDCDEVIAYETSCMQYDISHKPPEHSIIIISSPSSLKCFLNNFDWDDTYMAIVIGNTTKKNMPEYIKYEVVKHPSLKSCIELAKKYV